MTGKDRVQSPFIRHGMSLLHPRYISIASTSSFLDKQKMYEFLKVLQKTFRGMLPSPFDLYTIVETDCTEQFSM